MPVSRKYLDPKVIARLRGLELRARGAVSGAVSGMHRSVYRGYSVEFAEHRPYVPGDDIRHVDWRLFGRKDRLFIKQYEEETNLRLNILLDVSRSMAYGSASENKFDYACRLAASLAYLVVAQHDHVGLVTFDNEVRTRIPAATGQQQLTNILQILESSDPTGETRVKLLLDRLSEELRRRSVVVLISDLLAEPDAIVAGFEHLAHTGHELIVFHVMHPDEWELPFVENVQFEGLESPARLFADPQGLQESYRRAVQRFTSRLRAVCLKLRADYVPTSTRDPLDVTVCGYLSRRGGARPMATAPHPDEEENAT